MNTEALGLLEKIASPNDPLAESIRTLRSDLLRHLKGGRKLFLFSATWPQSGTSIVGLGCGCALAQLGMSVLLVDANLVERNLSRILGKEESPGLCQLSKELTSVPLHKEIPGVDFAPAGAWTSQPDEGVLEKPWVSDWLARVRPLYDAILIDTSPLFSSRQGLLLGRVVDGAYFVCSSAHFEGIPEGNHVEDWRELNVEILGIVSLGGSRQEVSANPWWQRWRKRQKNKEP